jgi:hypothetical protein
MEAELQDVASTPEAASTEVVDSSTTVMETSGESQGSVTATDAAQQSTQAAQTTTEIDPLEGVPSEDELSKLVEQKVPYSEALARLRPAYEGLKTKLAEYEPLEPWKAVAQAVPDPALAQSSYELVNALYTPSTENPSGFDPRPFLEQVEKDSPGTVDQLFATICSFPVNVDGQMTTVVRELYKAHGLNPDRIDDYRNIDNLRASGIVTEADLAKIPEKYHEAFKALPEDARTDILALKESNPALADQYLRNAERSMASEKFETQQREREQQEHERQEQQLAQQVENAVTQAVYGKIETWSGSIHQSLSSQWKPSTDEAINDLEYSKVLGTLAALQSPAPAYRAIAEKALKAAGGSLEWVDKLGNPQTFDGLINKWQTAFSAAVTYEQLGQQNSIPGKRAASEASQAEQRLLIKLNDYALKLAQPTSSRIADASTQQASQLAAASSRFVPAGNGTTQQWFENPYSQNPHPVGSPDYYAFNRKIDREYNLTNASVYGT